VEQNERKIKCVIWDLDNTMWNGILIEDNHVALRSGIKDIIVELDQRGILQSIASKNDFDLAFTALRELGLHEYFLYPQINWGPKSVSVKEIAKSINIGMDTIAFIDDQTFERDEVSFEHPQVLCIDATNLAHLLQMPEMNPRFITEDSKIRRLMYLHDIERNTAEERFEGPAEDFLASQDMAFTISPVKKGDLERAEELTIRTHQLNTTGYTYSYEELDGLRQSDQHRLYIASLDDKYGTYGKIGLMLIECLDEVWTIKLLLMSCRVMSRGVGTIMLNYIMNQAKSMNKCLRAEFVPNDRNRMMHVTYSFAGFKEIQTHNGVVILENDLSRIQPFPNYVKVNILEDKLPDVIGL
jgi:FkbH-like protein